MVINNPTLNKVDRFLRSITPKDKVCIVHDTDPDGICAAVIIGKCIERLRGKPIDMHLPLDRKIKGISPAMAKRFKQRKITKLIAADFSLEHDLTFLKKLEKYHDILIIDHHKLYNKVHSKKTVLYKPQLFTTIDPSRYCTAKLAYDAARRVTNVRDLDWMAAVGSIGDIATKPWTSWLNRVFKKYRFVKQKDLFKTKLGQVAAVVSSTEVYNEKLVPKLYDAFYNATHPRDIINSQYGRYKKIIDKELKKHAEKFKKTAKYDETRIYELHSPYRVNSVLSTILGLKYPHNTIIIINTSKPAISVSARRGDQKIAVNELLEQAVKGFKGANAGGHIPAAGAGFNKKYLNQFKQRIIKAS